VAADGWEPMGGARTPESERSTAEQTECDGEAETVRDERTRESEQRRTEEGVNLIPLVTPPLPPAIAAA